MNRTRDYSFCYEIVVSKEVKLVVSGYQLDGWPIINPTLQWVFFVSSFLGFVQIFVLEQYE